MEELEIMRRQLAEMKECLDTQKIVNDSLLRKVMKSDASWLNKYVIAQFILLPVVYLIFAGVSASLGISQWYAFIYLVLAMIDSTLDWRTVRIPPSLFSTRSLVDLRRRLIRQKRERFIQMCVMLPLAIVWVVAFFMAMYSATVSGKLDEDMQFVAYGGLAGGIFGGVVGFIVVVIIYRKMQGTNDSLLEDLNEFERGE